MRNILVFLFMLLTITCYGQANDDEVIFSPYVKSFIANYKTHECIGEVKKYAKQHEEVNVCFNGDEINIVLSVVNDENKKEAEIVSSMHFNLKEAEIRFIISEEDKTLQNIKIENSYASFVIAMDKEQKTKTILMSDKSKNQIYCMVYQDSELNSLAIALGAFDVIEAEPKDFEKNFKLISNKLSRYNVKSGFLE